MRLALLTNDFPSSIAPARGMFNFELAKAMSLQHDVAAVIPVSWIDQIRTRWSKGLRLTPGTESQVAPGTGTHVAPGTGVRLAPGTGVPGVRIQTYYTTYWYPPRIAHSRLDAWMQWSLRPTLSRVASEFCPEAVLSYWAHPDGAVAVAWANRLGIPGWIMVGGSDVLLLSKEPRRGNAIGRALRQADGIIAVSRNIAEELIRLGIPAERIHVVYRGVDTRHFHPADKLAARTRLAIPRTVPLFICVGRLAEVKGLFHLLEAIARAKRRGIEFMLALIGDGPLRNSLGREVQRLGIDDQVRFVGSVAHANLPTWYQAADWTVLTSLSEGVPNVLLESHACGTPFIATSVGGVPEIVVPGVDRLVPPADPEAMAVALAAALDQPDFEPAVLRDAVSTSASAADRIVGLLRGVQDNACSPLRRPRIHRQVERDGR